MNKKYYNERVLKTLKSYARSDKRNLDRRPLFVFSCGGEESGNPPHPAREALRKFIKNSNSPSLDNVICLKAEAIATDGVFDEMDLLTQEAIIADVADWLVIFAESVGSYCELGAFASLPHVQSITSVVVDTRYKGAQSFLEGGPVETIRRVGAPLSRVFYLDLTCPLASTDFTAFVSSIRSVVRESENFVSNNGRKLLNRSRDEVYIGSLVHELLDLVFLMSPVFENDLIALYRAVKGFGGKKTKVRSRVLELDMSKGDSTYLTVGQVISFMVASRMLYVLGHSNEGDRLLSCNVMLHDYFMFRTDSRGELASLRNQMALDKRRDGVYGKAGFYKRPIM